MLEARGRQCVTATYACTSGGLRCGRALQCPSCMQGPHSSGIMLQGGPAAHAGRAAAESEETHHYVGEGAARRQR